MELTLGQALQKGIEAHKAGQVQEADRLYTAILQAQPKHPDANHNMGVLAVGVGKVQEALPFFKIGLEASPNTAQFWLSYIDALIKLDRLADANAVFDQAKSNGAKGDGFDKLEQRLGGVEPTDTTAAQNQNPPHDKLQPLINLYSQGQLQEVLDQASQLLQQFPNSVTLYNIQGVANAGSGQLDVAINSYSRALAIQPNFAEAYNNMGSALQEQGKLEEAIQAYNKALTIKPDNAEAYYNMGSALQVQGKLEVAVDAYNRSLALKPDNAKAYYNMGSALKEQGKLEETIQAYNKALALKPDYADTYNNMGVTLQEQGKLEEAIEAYKKALALEPDYVEAYSNMGSALKEQGKLGEAIEAYNKALALKPDYAEAYSNMGIALQEQGKLDEAIEAFKKDGSPKSQIHLLKCLYKQDARADFYDQLDYLINQNENNATIGSYISRSQIRYGINKENPFCNDPLKHVLHTNLTDKCDFENIFVKGAADILTKDIVQNRSQSLLTNGIQTTGNVFNQIGDFTDTIQSILRSEIENYQAYFKDSQEGLIKSWPSDYEINGWLVSMKSGGKLAAHMHDKGWISGSIYINVPPKVNADSGNFVVCLDSERDSKSIDVVTGSLCLFPSSLLHYTIPFEADENRIVLAFDVIPK